MSPEDMARIHAAAMRVPRPWSAAEIAALLALPGTFAAARGDGFAIGRVTLDEAELLTLAVHPRAQRQRLGRACLAAFHEGAISRGGVSAFLEVAETNHAARTLYDLAGYVTAGRRAGYYHADRPIDALVLRRPLS